MKRFILFLFLLAALLFCLAPAFCFGQTPGQMGIPKWTVNGIQTQWLTPQNNKVFSINGSGTLVMGDAGGGGALSTLTDVTLTSPANNQLLRYNSASGKWVNWTANYLVNADLASYLLINSNADAGMNSLTLTETLSAPHVGVANGGYYSSNLWPGQIDFEDSLSGFSVTVLPPEIGTMTSNVTLRLPSATGTLLSSVSALNGANVMNASVTNAKLQNSSMTIDGTVRSLGDSFSVLPSGITLTGGAVSAVTITRNTLGTTPTTGLSLVNTTPATNNAQQVSPRAVFTGQGWKTTATAASQPVSFGFSVLPVQGGAAPTGTFLVESDVNNAGTWPDVLSLTTEGVLSLPNGAGGAMTQYGSVSNGVVRLAPAGQTAQVGTAGSVTLIGFVYPGGSASAGSLSSDGTGNIAQRGSFDPSLAQEYSIYNIDAGANDELGRVGWRANTNTFVIETVRTGTGTARPIQIRVNGTTAVTISATGAISLTLPTSAGASGTLWNDGGTVKVAP